MFKALKKASSTPVENTIRVKISYNNERCYKCDSNQNLIPITNDSNAVAYCKNCNIQIVLYEYIDEEMYKLKTEENIMGSRMYNPSAIKRESINYKRV
jgi:hypothetical protein